MPTQLSKFFIDATCKEYTHPWSDSCISASTGLWLHALQDSLRIYSTFYIVTLLMRGKVPSKEDIQRTILGILQSTAFLSWSGFTYSIVICFLRRILGRFHFLTVSFLPSFVSSLTAILIERPSRRSLLCLYVSNIATETLFRMGTWRGYFSVISHGETYIFALSVAILLYLFRTKKEKKDSIYNLMKFVIGPYETIENFKTENANSESLKHYVDTASEEHTVKCFPSNKQSQKRIFSIVWKSFEVYKQIIEHLKAQTKHISCPHPHSCIHYILTGAIRLFGCGICVQVALTLIFQIKRIFKNPKSIKRIITKTDNINPALFCGGFTGLYRLISCLLRRTFHKDSPNYAVPAGLIASIAFLAFPDNTIALYFMWKALQLLWNNAVESNKVPEIKWFPILLYCFSTALLFHVAIIEPQNLRPSYWKFLYNLSGGRIAAMSRRPLDEFGLETSKWLEKVLKETHTTNQHNYII